MKDSERPCYATTADSENARYGWHVASLKRSFTDSKVSCVGAASCCKISDIPGISQCSSIAICALDVQCLMQQYRSRSLIRHRLRFAMIAALCLAPALCHAQQGACVEAPAPVPRLAATAIYSDRNSSIIDRAGLHKNYILTLPVRRFVTQLSQLADNANSGGIHCALLMLGEWDTGQALLEQPSNFVGMRERQRFAVAIDVAAIKLMHRNAILPKGVIDWIGEVNARVMTDFGRRQAVDNLNAWSGVNAALASLITQDPASAAYAEDAWRAGIAQINEDGFLPTELKRAAKAMNYHEYYLDALLFLRAARQAAGRPPAAAENRKLKLLADRINREMCGGPEMAQRAGVPQDPPAAATLLPVAFAFGRDLVTSRWKMCSSGTFSHNDPTFGGDLDATVAALGSWRR